MAKSHSRFFKRKEEIVTDAEYALAKATRMVNTSKEAKILEQHRKQETKIDQKLDDLKKELEEMKDIDPAQDDNFKQEDEMNNENDNAE